MGTISLEGLDKAEVLAALYNASTPLGMGFLHYDPVPMTADEARELLARSTCFDYLKGRVMKVDLSGDELDPWLYDRDNGDGAAMQAIRALLSNDQATIREVHEARKAKAAWTVRSHLHEKSVVVPGEGIAMLHLGLDDVADVLGPAVDRAE